MPEEILDERFWEKVDRSAGPEACWEWLAVKTYEGYGQFRVLNPGRTKRAHRLAYEDAKGVIPKGLEIDHLCGNRGCVNPEHLEAITHRENVLRGNAPSAHHAKKTHCPKGHPYSEENTSWSNGKRSCTTCAKERRSRR